MQNKKQVLESIINKLNYDYKQQNTLIERKVGANIELMLKVSNTATFKDIFVLLTALDNVCFLNFYLEDKETFVIF